MNISQVDHKLINNSNIIFQEKNYNNITKIKLEIDQLINHIDNHEAHHINQHFYCHHDQLLEKNISGTIIIAKEANSKNVAGFLIALDFLNLQSGFYTLIQKLWVNELFINNNIDKNLVRSLFIKNTTIEVCLPIKQEYQQYAKTKNFYKSLGFREVGDRFCINLA